MRELLGVDAKCSLEDRCAVVVVGIENGSKRNDPVVEALLVPQKGLRFRKINSQPSLTTMPKSPEGVRGTCVPERTNRIGLHRLRQHGPIFKGYRPCSSRRQDDANQIDDASTREEAPLARETGVLWPLS